MSNVVIHAEGLSKRYQIGSRESPYRTLRETLVDLSARPFRAFQSRRRKDGSDSPETFWALRELSFEIEHGEAVGVIGRNGAGKSTLLKILARITEPTAGYADVYGRVGSLLEVGTGFHPELTGRENIFLMGAVLGMKRADIKRRFDEIVEFAEIERFLDTPVKRFSSGMYMRLAFSVAAHLDPDVLVVDEVLAVGDADFQRKCLGKMEDVAHEGRTVLFVSHNMPAVTRLCRRAILLRNGQLCDEGPSEHVASSYLNSEAGTAALREWHDDTLAPGNDIARLRAVRVRTPDQSPAEAVDIRDEVFVDVEYSCLMPSARPTANLQFVNGDGVTLFSTSDFSNHEWWLADRATGMVRATCWIPGNLFAEGRVSVHAALCSYNPDYVHCIEWDAVAFEVVDRSTGDGVRGPSGTHWPGVVRPMLRWKVDQESLSRTGI